MLSGHYVDLTGPNYNVDKLLDFKILTLKGIEVLVVAYDDHRTDKKASENMLMLKYNLYYRLSAVIDQYRFLIDQTIKRSFINLDRHPNLDTPNPHPFLFLCQNELSSMLDSIVFHLCSAFDYLGHFISYMFVDNKAKTADWDSLANKCRSQYQLQYKFADAIMKIDSGLRKSIESYRSGLIHKRRDYHGVNVKYNDKSKTLQLSYAVSKTAAKTFKKNIIGYAAENDYSMVYFASVLIQKSLDDMNFVLPYLMADLHFNSEFEKNFKNPKNSMGHSYLKSTSNKGNAIPISNAMWKEYWMMLQEFKSKPY